MGTTLEPVCYRERNNSSGICTPSSLSIPVHSQGRPAASTEFSAWELFFHVMDMFGLDTPGTCGGMGHGGSPTYSPRRQGEFSRVSCAVSQGPQQGWAPTAVTTAAILKTTFLSLASFPSLPPCPTPSLPGIAS